MQQMLLLMAYFNVEIPIAAGTDRRELQSDQKAWVWF
jgi:hypothetical protein